MKVIGIETSGLVGGLALTEDTQLGVEYLFQRGMVHGKYLLPTLQRVVKQRRLGLKDIGLIAVDIGPGSYTGLRVGLATAKALAFALERPLVGVASLDILIENISGVSPSDFICPVIDARWNQLYTALYRLDNGHYQRLTDYLALTAEEVIRLLPRHQKVWMVGDGLRRYGQIFRAGLKGKITFAPPSQWFPRPRNVARLGWQAFRQGKKDDYFSLVPLYLRPTEAELSRRRQMR